MLRVCLNIRSYQGNNIKNLDLKDPKVKTLYLEEKIKFNLTKYYYIYNPSANMNMAANQAQMLLCLLFETDSPDQPSLLIL